MDFSSTSNWATFRYDLNEENDVLVPNPTTNVSVMCLCRRCGPYFIGFLRDRLIDFYLLRKIMRFWSMTAIRNRLSNINRLQRCKINNDETLVFVPVANVLAGFNYFPKVLCTIITSRDCWLKIKCLSRYGVFLNLYSYFYIMII